MLCILEASNYRMRLFGKDREHLGRISSIYFLFTTGSCSSHVLLDRSPVIGEGVGIFFFNISNFVILYNWITQIKCAPTPDSCKFWQHLAGSPSGYRGRGKEFSTTTPFPVLIWACSGPNNHSSLYCSLEFPRRMRRR